jgi:hypothetical protein
MEALVKEANVPKSSVVGLFSAIKSISGIKPKENVEENLRIEQSKQLIEEKLKKAKILNPNCDRELTANLTQVQIIANINDQDFADNMNENEPSYVDTVIVKDPEFNTKEMHLADKKLLREFRIRKFNEETKQWSTSFNTNRFAIEIDGEVYKLNNKPENDLIMKIAHLEKCINVIRLNPSTSPQIKVNYWPNVYLMSKQAFENFFKGQQKSNGKAAASEEQPVEMPAILPFEQWYLKFWMPKSASSA